MAAKVYFAELQDNSLPEEQARRTGEVFEAAGAKRCIAPDRKSVV